MSTAATGRGRRHTARSISASEDRQFRIATSGARVLVEAGGQRGDVAAVHEDVDPPVAHHEEVGIASPRPKQPVVVRTALAAVGVTGDELDRHVVGQPVLVERPLDGRVVLRCGDRVEPQVTVVTSSRGVPRRPPSAGAPSPSSPSGRGSGQPARPAVGTLAPAVRRNRRLKTVRRPRPAAEWSDDIPRARGRVGKNRRIRCQEVTIGAAGVASRAGSKPGLSDRTERRGDPSGRHSSTPVTVIDEASTSSRTAPQPPTETVSSPVSTSTLTRPASRDSGTSSQWSAVFPE